MFCRASLSSLCVVLFVCSIATAQVPTIVPDPTNQSSFSGTISTLKSEPIANARVELRDLATGTLVASTYSNVSGQFQFSNIPNSSYEVVATSGLAQASERINESKSTDNIDLRLSVPDADNGASSAVSVAALKIPDKARKEFDKASDAFEKHKFDEAATRVNRALEIYPNYAQALLMKGVLFLQDSRPELAKPLFQQAINADPTFATPYVAMASILTAEEKYDDALRALDRAVPLAPNMWQIYFEMSKAQLAKADFEPAFRNASRAESLNPDRFGAINLLKAHALLGLKNYGQAITELEQYLSSAPQGPDSDHARDILQKAQALTTSRPAVAAASALTAAQR